MASQEQTAHFRKGNQKDVHTESDQNHITDPRLIITQRFQSSRETSIWINDGSGNPKAL